MYLIKPKVIEKAEISTFGDKIQAKICEISIKFSKMQASDGAQNLLLRGSLATKGGHLNGRKGNYLEGTGAKQITRHFCKLHKKASQLS